MKGDSRIFKRSLKSVPGKFLWCFKEVSKECQRSLKRVSRDFQGYFRKVSIKERVFQGDFKWVSGAFERGSKGI